MRRRAVWVVFAIAATLVAAAPARASTLTVNTTADNASANCQGTGPCSLRGAITEANRLTGPDTINVPAGGYTLNSQNLGEFPISSDITITGASAATTTIGGDGKNARIFHISSTSGKATISHLRLTFASVVSLPIVADRVGGIILVDTGAALSLDHVRIDNGQAVRGGGIAIRGGTADIAKSSIDNNHASQDGAGIINLGLAATPAKLTLTDSTVASNTNGTASGVQSTGNTGNVVTVTRSTIAYNDAGSNGGTGLRNESGTASVAGSILVENRGDGTPDNCGGTITSGGGNVENFNKCGFTLHDVDNTSGQLLALVPVVNFETPVLPIPATSVAVDLAGACTGADQRNLPRPQGLGCDAGAYEVDLAPDTTIDSGPSGTISTSTASFTFSSPEPGVTTFECKLDSGAFTSCTSPKSYSGLADGAHTFSVRAADSAGQRDPTPPSRAFTVDATAPDTNITGGPTGPTNVTSPSFTFTSEAGATFQCKLDGPGAITGTYAACTSAKSYTNLAQGTYTFSVFATDAAGNPDATPATRSFTVDTTAPDTNITGGPSGATSVVSPSFPFTSTEAGSTFQCKLDGPGATTGTYAACTTPNSYTNLVQGTYTFSVRAIDAAGNVDATPATRSFTVDTTPPDTNITGGPSGPSASTTAAFTFNSTEAGSTFQCRLDTPSGQGTFGACPASYTGLAQGAHTFNVRAIDAAGNVDPTPATRSFTVDTVAPDANITGGPNGPTNISSPTFTFNSTDAGSTFQCKLDGPGAATGTYASCTSPKSYTALLDGAYTFSVRATDAAGNQGTASRTFALTTTTPDTGITDGPSGPTNDATPTFTFNSTKPSSTFQCKLDGPGATTGTFGACTSPKAYTTLAQGTYTFSVRATDAAGNTDPTPAAQEFTVDLTPPETTITGGPDGATNLDPTFEFTSNEPTATFECRVDRAGAPPGSYGPCGSPKTYGDLSEVEGVYTFLVRATDAAGNTDGTPATRQFTVDTHAPGPPAITTPAADVLQASQTVTLTGTVEANASVEVFDGATSRGTVVAPGGNWTLPLANVPEGTHVYTAKATDAAGNVSGASAGRTVTVDLTPPPANVISGPSGPTTETSPAFGFASTDGASTFTCKLDGPGAVVGTFGPCASPKSFIGLAPGDYVFFVRATDPAGNTTTTSRSFIVTAVQKITQQPTPVPGQSVVIQPVSGKTLVKLPGSNTFEPVDVTRGIPNGSTVDTKKGKIRLFAIPKTGKPAESALFYQGIFKVKLAGGITELQLVEALSCPKAGKADVSAKKPKTRKLWGDGSGSFRTRGQYSAATVRGTRWLVQDSCGKTLTKVAKGVVEVQDFVKRKKILVRAPKSYTAKQKKR